MFVNGRDRDSPVMKCAVLPAIHGRFVAKSRLQRGPTVALEAGMSTATPNTGGRARRGGWPLSLAAVTLLWGCVTSTTGNEGGGGAATVATTSSPGVTTTTTEPAECPPEVGVSDPLCPPSLPRSYTSCDVPDLSCVYEMGNCARQVKCVFVEVDPEDLFACGDTGYVWFEAEPKDCDGCFEGCEGCVPCLDANAGDPCHDVGHWCIISLEGNCPQTLECGANQTWTYSNPPGCCAP